MRRKIELGSQHSLMPISQAEVLNGEQANKTYLPTGTRLYKNFSVLNQPSCQIPQMNRNSRKKCFSKVRGKNWLVFMKIIRAISRLSINRRQSHLIWTSVPHNNASVGIFRDGVFYRKYLNIQLQLLSSHFFHFQSVLICSVFFSSHSSFPSSTPLILHSSNYMQLTPSSFSHFRFSTLLAYEIEITERRTFVWILDFVNSKPKNTINTTNH